MGPLDCLGALPNFSTPFRPVQELIWDPQKDIIGVGYIYILPRYKEVLLHKTNI